MNVSQLVKILSTMNQSANIVLSVESAHGDCLSGFPTLVRDNSFETDGDTVTIFSEDVEQ